MLKFYSDRKQTFECKINIKGSKQTPKNTNVKLVFEDAGIQRFYEGKMDVVGNCSIEIPPLKDHKKLNGKCILEVRVDDVIFVPYESKFSIEKSMVDVKGIHVNDKITESKGSSKSDVSKSIKKVMKESLETFKRMDTTHKLTLLKYIKEQYTPKPKVKRFVMEHTNNSKHLNSKILMFMFENSIK